MPRLPAVPVAGVNLKPLQVVACSAGLLIVRLVALAKARRNLLMFMLALSLDGFLGLAPAQPVCDPGLNAWFMSSI